MASASDYGLRSLCARHPRDEHDYFGVGIHGNVVLDVLDGALDKAEVQKRRECFSVNSERMDQRHFETLQQVPYHQHSLQTYISLFRKASVYRADPQLQQSDE